MAKDRAKDSRRVFQNPISHVRTLSPLGVGSDNSVYKTKLEGKPLSDISVTTKATKWDGNKLEEATSTAQSGRAVAKATGKTPAEARQKAYNLASSKKVEGAKSGETARASMKAEEGGIGGKRNVVKINSGVARDSD